MKDQKKPFRYYLMIFVLSAVIVIVYSIYMVATDRAEIKDLYSLLFMPFFFTIIYYAGDVLIQKIANRKKKPNPEVDFMNIVGERMRASGSFLLEDFRKLQTNAKFQESLKIAFKLLQEGDSETWSLDKLEKRFRPQTLEARAMTFAISYIAEERNKASK